VRPAASAPLRSLFPRLLGASLGLTAAGVGVGGCGEPVSLAEEPLPTVLQVGQTRELELRALKLEVTGFEERLDAAALRALPDETLASVWLLDLDLRPVLVTALEQLRDLSEADAAALTVPAQNLRRLLRTTPDNVILTGTKLEELIGLAGAVGVPPARALADLLQIGLTDEVLPVDVAAAALADGLVASHPRAQFRPGPATPENPSGLVPVAPGSIPITLLDVADGFTSLASRFGAVGAHPGFVSAVDGLDVLLDDFEMVVAIDVNALPYKGVDLTSASVASVNSTPSQIDGLFPTDSADWLTIRGLVAEPKIGALTLTVVENDGFVAGGATREPLPRGASPAWDLVPWELERILVDAAQRDAARLVEDCDEYTLGTGTVALRGCVDATGWVTLETFTGIGNPPPPAYVWDLLLEIAQVRLHDGGLAEGEADAEVTLRDLPLGLGADAFVAQIRDNLAANPGALLELAVALTDNTVGDADVFYVRSDADGRDYLYFVAPVDMRRGPDGLPAREYAYARPGFFADEALSTKVSSTAAVDGDVLHEKIAIAPGDVLYVEDDAGAVFRLDVGDKPSRARVQLSATRVR
jgi:hypothetical protein